MKLLVCVKRVVDYNVKIRVKRDGSGRRAGQRQDVDEPVRRDRGRGGGAPEGTGQGHRDRRRLHRPATGRRDHPHGARHGRRPRHPGQDRRCRRAAGGGQDPGQGGRAGEARPRHHGQAGHRRRCQPDRPDAGRPARLAAGHVRLQGRCRRGLHRRHPRGRWRAADGGLEAAGHRHHGPAPQRAALCQLAQHHEGQEEAARRDQPGDARRRRGARA